MRLFIKWSNLTNAQKEQVKAFFQEAIEKREIVLQNNSYRINSRTGDFMNETP